MCSFNTCYAVLTHSCVIGVQFLQSVSLVVGGATIWAGKAVGTVAILGFQFVLLVLVAATAVKSSDSVCEILLLTN